MSDTKPLFRAGDVVEHATGERWQLSIDQIGANVFPCGSPAIRAQAAACKLVVAASSEDRMAMLVAIARSDRRDVDFRSEHARSLLVIEAGASEVGLEKWKEAAIGVIRELVDAVTSSNSRKDRKDRARALAAELGIEIKE